MEKCKRMKRQRCTSQNWIYSWLCLSVGLSVLFSFFKSPDPCCWIHPHWLSCSAAKKCCTTESPWRSTFTLLQELRDSKFEALDAHEFCRRRNSAITQSTTWLCSCEKRMQTIPWRALGKDPRKIQSHSLQSTKKTAKRATIWGQRRIRLRWPQNRLEVLQRVVGETCRQLRQDRGPTCKQLRHRRQRGTKPIGRRALGILSILQALTCGDFFSELRHVSVAWTTDGCVNSTPTNTARTELDSMIAFHHANTRGSRAAKLKIAHFCVL